jgi:hypothetical protein
LLIGKTQMDDYVAFDTPAELEHQRLDLRWLALWTLAYILAIPLFGVVAVGLVFSLPIGGGSFSERLSVVHAFTLAGTIGGAITGTLVGMGQRLLLRPWVPWAERWIPATIVGWALGGAIWWTLEWLLNDIQIQIWGQDTNVRSLVSGILGGTGIGIAQWLLLRERSSLSSLWVIVTTMGWTTGWILAQVLESLIFVTGGEDATKSSVVTIASILGMITLIGGSAGATTGIAMKILISWSSMGTYKR